MATAYKTGYIAGQYFTRAVKWYLATKVADKTIRKVNQIAKHHSIDKTNPAVVTENLFDCLDYLD